MSTIPNAWTRLGTHVDICDVPLLTYYKINAIQGNNGYDNSRSPLSDRPTLKMLQLSLTLLWNTIRRKIPTNQKPT